MEKVTKIYYNYILDLIQGKRKYDIIWDRKHLNWYINFGVVLIKSSFDHPFNK